MKKRNLKSLSLSKKTISTFSTSFVLGGSNVCNAESRIICPGPTPTDGCNTLGNLDCNSFATACNETCHTHC